MERVIDLSKVKVKPDEVLVEVIQKEKKSLIISLDEDKGKDTFWDHLIILAKGKNVDDVEVGDIILKTDIGTKVLAFEEKIQGKMLGIIRRYFCAIIVSPDNFKN